jgi:hypothetical protein
MPDTGESSPATVTLFFWQFRRLGTVAQRRHKPLKFRVNFAFSGKGVEPAKDRPKIADLLT